MVQPKKSPNIWDTFENKFVTKNFQKAPNLVTLITCSTTGCFRSHWRKLFKIVGRVSSTPYRFWTKLYFLKLYFPHRDHCRQTPVSITLNLPTLNCLNFDRVYENIFLTLEQNKKDAAIFWCNDLSIQIDIDFKNASQLYLRWIFVFIGREVESTMRQSMIKYIDWKVNQSPLLKRFR